MKIIIENATLADVVSKAAKVAPTRGSDFDKARGLLFRATPDGELFIRATNTEIFYTEKIDYVSLDGEGDWRVPSMIMDAIASRLPIGTDKEVTLEEVPERRSITIKSGRIAATLRLDDASYYPEWEAFDPNELEIVPSLGARIKQVEWAAMDSGEPPWSGIHLNGEIIVATDRFRVAMVPCEAEPIYRPITVPSGIFEPVIRTMGDAAIGISDNQLLIMPDTSTQIAATIYATKYPDVAKALKRDQKHSFECKKEDLLEMIARAMVFVGSSRFPLLTVFIGKEEVAVMMSDEEMGLLGDALELDGQCTHKRIKMLFTPKNLTEALQAAPSDKIRFHYEDDPNKAVRVDGGSGYEAWVMPRREGQD